MDGILSRKNGSIAEPLGKSENASTQKCLREGDDISFRRGITCITLLGCCGTWGWHIHFLHVALEQDVESFKKDSCFSFCNDNNIVRYNTAYIIYIYIYNACILYSLCILR